MKSYKDPSFQDRVGSAAQAKQKALERLKAKPPIDESVIAERRARAEPRKPRKRPSAPPRSKPKRLEDEARAAAEAERIARGSGRSRGRRSGSGGAGHRRS
jgi:hypothetical protein